MSTTDKWVFESTLDNKKFLKSQQNLERSMQRMENRVRKLKVDTEKQEVKHTQTVAAAKTKSEQAQRRQQDKTAAAADRERAKQQAKQAKFEKWKLTQYRSTAFQRLSVEQKMNLKRVLSSQRSEEEIRDEFQKTTAAYRRELAQRKAYEKKQRSVTSAGAGAGARGAGMAGGAGVGGGAMALMGNPYALAAGAAVVGGGMLINAGADNVTETRRAADDAGVDFQTFDRRAFVDSNVSGMSTDKIGQIYQDVNDKLGDFTSNVEVGKDGNFKGGGELTDVANLLKQETGASNDEVMKMFKGSSIEVADRVNEALKNTDTQTQTFALESLASDLFKLQQARGNEERVTQAQQTFDSMNLGFSDDDLAKINEVSVVMDGFFSVLSRAPTEAFKSFASNLSPQTLETLGSLGELIVNVAGIIGDVFAVALNMLTPILNPLVKVINWVIGGIKKLTGWIADLTSTFNSIFAPLNYLNALLLKVFGVSVGDVFTGWVDDFSNGFDTLKAFMANALTGWFKDLADALPDWMTPDSWKQSGDDMPKQHGQAEQTQQQQQQQQTRQQTEKEQKAARAAGVQSATVQGAIAYNNYNKTDSYNSNYTYNSSYKTDNHSYNSNHYNKNDNRVNNVVPATPAANDNAYTTPPAYVAQAQAARKQLPALEQANPYAARAQAAMQAQKVEVANRAEVAINLDGEQIASAVVGTEDFREAQNKHLRMQNRRND